MRQAWPIAVLVSIGLHAAAFSGAALRWRVQDLAPQSRPETRLNIATQSVSASTATPTAPRLDAAVATAPSGTSVGSAAIAQSTAQAAALPIAKTPPVPPAATKAPSTAALSTPAPAVAAPAATLPTPPAGVAAVTLGALGARLPNTALGTAPAASASTSGQSAQAISPPSQRGTASLAWSSQDAALDALSLAAVQAFMQPDDLATSSASAGLLRDGIAATLAAVSCARLQTSFDPETGSIELRGHLPEEGARAPVLAAVQAQVGPGIPVTDRLRLLPRPQCGALTAIADVGLAQSTEQDTNPRMIGADTYVRDYTLAEGQRLVFGMTAPDYPAIVYVDYFDAAGMVLHMQPNDQVPAVLSPAKSTLAVGQDAPGVPALQLRVGPPFGQEIAVAFAASVPLYDGVRPTVEPAGPYLEFLKQAVADARAKTPDFKGEWVYFFVTTTP